MTLLSRDRFPSFAHNRSSQGGVVLLLSLIILVVLLGAAAALVRSFDTSLFIAGNLAFKRDLINLGEQAVPRVFNAFDTSSGLLNTNVRRAVANADANYSASTLPTNEQGIPSALLLTSAGFDGALNADPTPAQFAKSSNDFTVGGATVRYVIDRQCTVPGDEATVMNQCGTWSIADARAGRSGKLQVIYRLSIRVDGPRDTQTFLQTTFTR